MLAGLAKSSFRPLGALAMLAGLSLSAYGISGCGHCRLVGREHIATTGYGCAVFVVCRHVLEPSLYGGRAILRRGSVM